MGIYLNPGNAGFQSMVKGLYIDKTGLISYINSTLSTKDKLTCVSRPRRFGKSFAAQMLCAYYDKSCRSKELFMGLEISKAFDFEKHLNQYHVIYLDITWFISITRDIRNVVTEIQESVIEELKAAYQGSVSGNARSLPVVLTQINATEKIKFIIIIDEWDALFREAKEDIILQKEYLQMLRGLFKSNQTDKIIEAAYMTGILPIKKYGTQSALTDFKEFTMIRPLALAEYVGFTEWEVKVLCEEFQMDFEETKKWYDGYSFSKVQSVYSPNSVISAMKNGEFGTYWTETETYESLKLYIDMNFDGLKDSIVAMLGGARCKITTRKFQNDMTNIKSRDDVLTLLIHLGYLAYDSVHGEVFIPNMEISYEFENAIDGVGWDDITLALRASEALLDATLAGNAEAVAQAIDEVHMANTSVLAYNDENSLSCAVTIAYYSAKKEYTLIREFPTGKGFADIVFLPRKSTLDKPALIVELKWDRKAEGAISQIKDKKYVQAIDSYNGEILLVGINYDKKSKKHDCQIEKYWK